MFLGLLLIILLVVVVVAIVVVEHCRSLDRTLSLGPLQIILTLRLIGSLSMA